MKLYLTDFCTYCYIFDLIDLLQWEGGFFTLYQALFVGCACTVYTLTLFNLTSLFNVSLVVFQHQ